MTMPSVRQATLQLLRDLGCSHIFGNPGSTELPLFRNFPADFTYVLGLQESVVIGLADGYAQATRKPALVNLHSSAGTGHALGNLFTAYKSQTPLVVTAGQQARSIMSYDPFLFAERATEFPQPFVKWAIEPARAADVPHAIARAFAQAVTPPCGPTFVSIPVDDWDAETDYVEPRNVATLNPGDPEALAALGAGLANAKNPCFVLGPGVARDGAWDDMVKLAELHGAAVFCGVYSSRNVFPESHPLFAGFLPPFRNQLTKILTGFDLVVSFGGALNIYHAEGDGPHIPHGTECWIVCDDPKVLSWAPAGHGILANIRAATVTLGGVPGCRTAVPRSGPLRERPTALDATIFDDRLLMQRIAAHLPEGAIIVEEAPTSRAALQDQIRLDEPDRFFTTASGGLGHSMPAAVGIALANPEKRVVAIIGDGSAMYGIQSLHAAFQLGTRVTFIIANNRRYEALRMFGRAFGLQSVVGTQLDGLDFVHLAKGQGISMATRVSDAGALDVALQAAFATDLPNLIEAHIE